MVTPEAGRSSLRASHADRDLVIDTLKTAFVQGRLTKDELDALLGQALAARTFRELAEATADIPTGSDLTKPPQPGRAPVPRPANRGARMAVKSGVAAIAAIVVTVSASVAAAGQPIVGVVLAVFIVILAAVASVFVGSIVGAVLMMESRRRKRSQGRFPTRPRSGASGGEATQRLPSAGPFRSRDRGKQHTAEATLPRRSSGLAVRAV